MTDILAITAPIYLIILLGYALTRAGLFDRADMRVLGKFVVNLALPALVFKSLSQRPLLEILNPGYLLAYALGSGALIALGFWWSRRVAGLTALASTFHAMGMSCPNSGFVGYPILLLTLPSVAGVALALNMIVENLLMIPLLLLLAERARGGEASWALYRSLLRKLASNPLMLAIVAGLLVSLAELRLPALAVQTVNLFAAASSAMSLFVIGGTLVGVSIGGLGRQVVPIMLGKLLLHPLIIVAALALVAVLGLAPVDPALQTALVLFAAVPMMGIYTTLAQQFGQEDFSAVAQLLTTIASFFSLSALLWILKGQGLLA